MTENERIKEVRKHFSLTMEAFGARVGLKKSAISLVESGRNSVSDQLRNSVCREFNISETWLRTGEGEMISSNRDVASDFANKYGLDKAEEILIREYLLLSQEERAVFRRYLKRVIAELDVVVTSDEQRQAIIDKVQSYSDELMAEANSSKLEASQITKEDA